MTGAGGHGAQSAVPQHILAGMEPAFVPRGWALLGPRGQDGSGIIAGVGTKSLRRRSWNPHHV